MNIIRSKHLMISSLFVIISLLSTCANSTLNTSAIFRDNGDTLISPRGIFELGFFSSEDSTNRYVGIWYKKITPRTVVWVANRDNPLTDRTGALRVVKPGLLVLLNATNSTIWSTNTSRSVQNPVAHLLDSGNLLVRDADDGNPENFIWQSFDYPTDTLLPGMKLGKNFVTGLEVYITSSKSTKDSTSGDFTYHFDPTNYHVIKRGPYLIYSSALRNGRTLDGSINTIYTDRVFINENEVFYYYKLLNDSAYTRFVLLESGFVVTLVWVDRTQDWVLYTMVPKDNCDMYNTCGPYGKCSIENSPMCKCLDQFEPKDLQDWARNDWSNGCIRRTPLNCKNGDEFIKYSGIKLPDSRGSWLKEGISLGECAAECSENCSCVAYASLDINRYGCLFWSGNLVDIREMGSGQDIYIRMASSISDPKPRKRKILIVVLPLVFVLTLVAVCLLLCSQKRKRMNHQLPATGRLRHKYTDNHPDQSLKDLELPLFDLSTITKATDNFSIINKLGQGGFGPVYKVAAISKYVI